MRGFSNVPRLGLYEPKISWLRQAPGDNEVTLGRPRRWNPHVKKKNSRHQSLQHAPHHSALSEPSEDLRQEGFARF